MAKMLYTAVPGLQADAGQAVELGLALHARRVKEANTVSRRLALMQKASQPTSGRGADLAGNPFPMVGHPFTQRILSRSRDLFLKVEL